MNVISYSPKQMESIEQFIDKNFGTRQYTFHETKSNYVHTDAAIIKDTDGPNVVVTFGMGARESDSPLEEFKHTELLVSASPDFDFQSCDGAILLEEIVGLSKIPFRNKTWFGTGHTVPASRRFKKQFGYDAFLLMKNPQVCCVPDVGNVSFLLLIPIYAEEQQWMMENDSIMYLNLIQAKLDTDEALFCDKKRAPYIPDEDETSIGTLMRIIGIDYETAVELRNYIVSMGKNFTYDMIDDWLAKN